MKACAVKSNADSPPHPSSSRKRSQTISIETSLDEVRLLLLGFINMGLASEHLNNLPLARTVYNNALKLHDAYFSKMNSKSKDQRGTATNNNKMKKGNDGYYPALKQSVSLLETVPVIPQLTKGEDYRYDRSTSTGIGERDDTHSRAMAWPTAVDGHATALPKDFDPQSSEMFKSYCHEVVTVQPQAQTDQQSRSDVEDYENDSEAASHNQYDDDATSQQPVIAPKGHFTLNNVLVKLQTRLFQQKKRLQRQKRRENEIVNQIRKRKGAGTKKKTKKKTTRKKTVSTKTLAQVRCCSLLFVRDCYNVHFASHPSCSSQCSLLH